MCKKVFRETIHALCCCAICCSIPLLPFGAKKARNKEITVEDEKKCGRPLDVRWHAGKLYILDAYHGLFELDVKAGRAKHLVCP